MPAGPAGILSSYGEMEHMRSGKADFVPFDPHAKQPKMSYKVMALLLQLAFAAWSADAALASVWCNCPVCNMLRSWMFS